MSVVIKLVCCCFLLVNISCNEVEDAYLNFMLVPQSIRKAPREVLYIDFVTTLVNLGNVIHPFDTLQVPYVAYSTVRNGLYTLIVIDPDIPFMYQPFDGQLLEAMIVNIPTTNVRAGDRISIYRPHIPYPGSGYHRCLYLIYKQPRRIQIPLDVQIRLSTNLTGFVVEDFAASYDLGEPIAGNFYISQLTLCGPTGENTTSNCTTKSSPSN